jgi:hypothetical protein
MRRNPGNDPDFYKISKLDILLVLTVLFLSSFSIAWKESGILKRPQTSQTAFIYEKNKLIGQISLEKDGTFELLNNRIEIEVNQGRVRIAKSDCPQQTCRHMSWIKHKGQTIVCVPNKVFVEIKGAAPSVVDAVAF